MTPRLIAYQAVPQVDSGAATGAPESGTGQAAGESGAGSSLFMFLMFVPLILLLFWQTRSQQKKQEKAVAGLKKGDRVVTQSGLVGKLLELDQRYAKLELGPGMKVTVLRSSLAGRDAEDSAKAGDAKGSDAKSSDAKVVKSDDAKAAKSDDAKSGDKDDKETSK